MTESSRRDRREAQTRRRRTQIGVAIGLVLVVALGLAVYLVAFRDDDSPTAKDAATSTSAAGRSTTTPSTAPGSSAPPSSGAPDTTAPPETTAPPPLASAPAENVNASGASCGGDNQPAIAGTWVATAPTKPVGGGDAELALRQEDGTSVAGLPVTAVVSAPGGRTWSSNPVAVAALRRDATVAFPKDFPTADGFRFEGKEGLYAVRWQTVGGSSLACAGFQVG